MFKSSAGTLFLVAAIFFSAPEWPRSGSRLSPAAQELDGVNSFRIGWAEADITPEKPVVLTGQNYVRISEGVLDPLSATVLALESVRPGGGDRAVMVSCDLVSISDTLRDAVRDRLSRELAELPPEAVIMSATHTHTAPYHYAGPPGMSNAERMKSLYGVELPVMSGDEYVSFAARRIADAVAAAWRTREPAGIAFGLGHAVVGRNRLVAYRDGSSVIYGPVNRPAFSHVEGYEDHSVHLLSTYRPDGTLTGLLVNLACPSQAGSTGWRVSADFWHETRLELRARFGENIRVLVQHGPAGDQNSRAPVERAAEERMERLAGRTRRAEIAVRIADAVERVLPLIKPEIVWNPEFAHRVEIVALPRRPGVDQRPVSEADEQRARAESARYRARYEQLLAELEANPQLREQPRWYTAVTEAYRQSRRRLPAGRPGPRNPSMMVELHALRIGDIAFATNPFELYLDYGMRIRGRSPALQTFLVQLAGPGSYLPTARSIAGGAYGATGFEVGTEAGDALVEWSVEALEKLWGKGRGGNPGAVAARRLRAGAPLDGRLDKDFWRGLERYALGPFQGKQPESATTFMIAWDGAERAFYFGIACEEPGLEDMAVTDHEPDDLGIFSGSYVEMLFETPVHSHYQLAVGSTGALADLDQSRGVDKTWDSRAEAAVHRGEGYWSIEVRLPVFGEDQKTRQPLVGVAGDEPTRESPWHFNLFRQRLTAGAPELAVFSPAGQLHDRSCFGSLFVDPPAPLIGADP